MTSESSILGWDREAGKKRKGEEENRSVKSGSLRRDFSCRYSQVNLRAEIVLSSQAIVASGFSTRHTRLDGNSVAWLNIVNILSDCDDNSSRFVTQSGLVCDLPRAETS